MPPKKRNGKHRKRAKKPSGAGAQPALVCINSNHTPISPDRQHIYQQSYGVQYHRIGLLYEMGKFPLLDLIADMFRPLDEIEKFIAEHPEELRHISDQGTSPLHVAAIKGRADVVESLITKHGLADLINHPAVIPDGAPVILGTSINVPVTPLMCAVICDQLEVCESIGALKRDGVLPDVDVDGVDLYPNKQSNILYALVYNQRCLRPLIDMGGSISCYATGPRGEALFPIAIAVMMQNSVAFEDVLSRSTRYLYEEQSMRNLVKTLPHDLRPHYFRLLSRHDVSLRQYNFKEEIDTLDYLPEDIRTHFAGLDLRAYDLDLARLNSLTRKGTERDALVQPYAYYAFFGMNEPLAKGFEAVGDDLWCQPVSDINMTVLEFAMMGKNHDGVTALMDTATSFDPLSDIAQRILFRMVLLNDAPAIEYLVEILDVSPDFPCKKDDVGMTLIQYAISIGLPARSLTLLLRHSKQSNKLGDVSYAQPLRDGNVEAVKLLMQRAEEVESSFDCAELLRQWSELPETPAKSALLQMMALHPSVLLPAVGPVTAGAGAAAPHVQRQTFFDPLMTSFLLNCLEGNAITVSQMLADKPERIYERTNAGETAMHLAVRSGNRETVELIVNHEDCEHDTYSSQGVTPIHIALKTENTEAIKLLWPYVNDQQLIESASGRSILHCIVQNPRIITVLAEVDLEAVHIDVDDAQDNTPAVLAMKAGLYSWARFLIERGASPYAENFDNESVQSLLFSRYPVTARYNQEQRDLLTVIQTPPKTKSLKEKLDDATNAPAVSSAQVKSYRSRFVELTAQITSLKAEVEELKAPQTEAYDKTLSDLLAGEHTNPRELVKRDKQIAKLQSTIAENAKELASLRKRPTQKAFDEVASELTKVKAALAERPTKDAHQALTTKATALVSKLLAVSTERDELQTDVTRLTAELAAAKETIAKQADEPVTIVRDIPELIQKSVADAVSAALAPAQLAPVFEAMSLQQAQLKQQITQTEAAIKASVTALSERIAAMPPPLPPTLPDGFVADVCAIRKGNDAVAEFCRRHMTPATSVPMMAAAAMRHPAGLAPAPY